MAFATGARGSDKWPEKPAFCVVPAGPGRAIENVPNGKTGGGKLPGREHSFRWTSIKALSATRAERSFIAVYVDGWSTLPLSGQPGGKRRELGDLFWHG
jgi:hypothetical protein